MKLSQAFTGAFRDVPIRLWAILGAGPVLTAFAGVLVFIVWKGGWERDRQEQQLWYLGTAMLVVLGLLGIVVVALAAVRIRGEAPGGVHFEVESQDGDPPPAKITTTVETKQ